MARILLSPEGYESLLRLIKIYDITPRECLERALQLSLAVAEDELREDSRRLATSKGEK